MWDWLTEEEQNLIASTMLSAHRWDKRCAAREQGGRHTFKADAFVYKEREECGLCDDWWSLEKKCFTCKSWEASLAERWGKGQHGPWLCGFRNGYYHRGDACRAWVRHPELTPLLRGECPLRNCLREYAAEACRAFRRKK